MNLYLLLSLISMICFGLQFEPMSHMAAWQINDIESGQWWRIVTGNFTHTNFAHLTMNIIGLWAIGYLFQPKPRTFSLLLVGISAWVGLYLLFTHIQSYVGLSGALHGLFAFYALKEALLGRKSSWWLFLGITIKVASEQWFGASTSSAEMIQARVAIEAHLAGLVAGGIVACLAILKKRLNQ